MSAWYERRHDELRYHFDNRSSFDTSFLVDHFFEQRYEAHNHWLGLRVSAGPGNRRFVAEAGATPEVATFGEDVDTFFNPGGDVVTSGTSGEVRMRSLRAGLALEVRRPRGPVFSVGYTFRRDRSVFRTPEVLTVTHSSPPSVERSITTGRETTTSHVHQLRLGAAVERKGTRWTATAGADVSPAMLARLATVLPDKYPGRTIVFWASGFELSGRASLRRSGRLALTFSVDAGRSFGYDGTAVLRRTSLGAGVAVDVAR